MLTKYSSNKVSCSIVSPDGWEAVTQNNKPHSFAQQAQCRWTSSNEDDLTQPMLHCIAIFNVELSLHRRSKAKSIIMSKRKISWAFAFDFSQASDFKSYLEQNYPKTQTSRTFQPRGKVCRHLKIHRSEKMRMSENALTNEKKNLAFVFILNESNDVWFLQKLAFRVKQQSLGRVIMSNIYDLFTRAFIFSPTPYCQFNWKTVTWNFHSTVLFVGRAKLVEIQWR